MTFLELSVEYRQESELLRSRILELQLLWSQCRTESARFALSQRIRVLTAMRKDTRDIALLCEHYYERGYHRNEKYTL